MLLFQPSRVSGGSEPPALVSLRTMKRRGFATLNVVIKITEPSGWRTEWDIGFREDGSPRSVTLSQFTPQNTVTMMAPPIEVSFETFYAELQKMRPA